MIGIHLIGQYYLTWMTMYFMVTIIPKSNQTNVVKVNIDTSNMTALVSGLVQLSQ
jgi:hypothetical protein